MIQPPFAFFGRAWRRGPAAALVAARRRCYCRRPSSPRPRRAPMPVAIIAPRRWRSPSFADPLPHTALRLAAGKSLTIVALGSSSTYGTGASKPEYSYPSRLATLLHARYPNTEIRVINRGVGGEVVGEHDAAHRHAKSIGDKPDLVIWQVGTNDVLARCRSAGGDGQRARRHHATPPGRRRCHPDGSAICAGGADPSALPRHGTRAVGDGEIDRTSPCSIALR